MKPKSLHFAGRGTRSGTHQLYQTELRHFLALVPGSPSAVASVVRESGCGESFVLLKGEPTYTAEEKMSGKSLLVSSLFVLILAVSGIMYWGQPVFKKSCAGRILRSDEDAIQRAYSFWSSAEIENKKWPYFKSPHYQNAVELLDDSKKEKYLGVSKKWVWLKFSYEWEVHAEVFKWYPSYYDLFVVFDGCGNEIKHGGV